MQPATQEPYRRLAETFNTGDFQMAQVRRSKYAAIYSQSQAGEIVAYEAVKILHHEAGDLFGVPQPAREGYPPTSQWGKLGWSYSGPDALSNAEDRFQMIDCTETAP